MYFRLLSLIVAIAVQFIVILGSVGAIGMSNSATWQAVALLFFFMSFLVIPSRA